MSAGWLEVITGPMFSGKTTQLIHRLSQARAVGQQVQVFKPESDTRDGEYEHRSHAGQGIEVVAVSEARQISALVHATTRVVALDEAQFFDSAVVEVCRELADGGRRVIVAGLDLDYRRQPFGSMPQLLAMAESVTKLTTLCSICGEPAVFTQRLLDGEPAAFSGPVVLVGGRDMYVARCRRHYGASEDGRNR